MLDQDQLSKVAATAAQAAERAMPRPPASGPVVSATSGGWAINGDNNHLHVESAATPDLGFALKAIWPWWWRYVATFCICVLAMVLQRQIQLQGTADGDIVLVRLLTTSSFPQIVAISACLALFLVSSVWLVFFSWRKPRA